MSQEFISAEEYAAIALPGPSGSPERVFNRRSVAQAYVDTFHNIGGVAHMTEWAQNSPTEFYKQFAKLMPASGQSDDSEREVIIRHALPPTILDSE